MDVCDKVYVRPYTQMRERTASWRKVCHRDQIHEWELTHKWEGEVEKKE